MPQAVCQQCGYDVRAQSLGDACPECGRQLQADDFNTPRTSFAVKLLFNIACLAMPLSFAFAVLFDFHEYRHRGSIALTAVILILFFCCAVVGAAQYRFYRRGVYWLCYVLSCLAGLFPLLLCITTYRFFVTGGFSTLYDTWLMLFPLFVIGVTGSFLLSLALLCAPPYRGYLVISFALPLAALSSATLSILILATHHTAI